MVKVDNKEIMRDLAGKFMKISRGRSRLAILAIVLTCMLFTNLFTGTSSMILSKRAADMRQMMSTSHALVQDLTKGEYEAAAAAVDKNKTVERYGRGMFLGSGVDERYGFSVEVRSADENMAESFQQVPSCGHLPEHENELAAGSLVLEALGVPQEPGAEITITYEQNPATGELCTDTFRLCGYWESDHAAMAQMLWVSGTYAEAHRYPVTEKDLKNGLLNGGYDLVVWYQNQWNLSGKTDTLNKESGLMDSSRSFEVNPAYQILGEDGFSFDTVAALIILIVLAGYLIIYNIFNISIQTDIRIYGLLKNIGTTGKQLKKLVHMQVWRLSVIGIPCGLIAGYLSGVWISPLLVADGELHAELSGQAETVISCHPAIFIAAALLTFGTVYLSVMQSCRLVEKVTPVDALRMAEDTASVSDSFFHIGKNRIKKQKRKHENKKTNLRYNWFTMAFWNFRRNIAKGIIVMLSVALSLVVMDCIVILVQGYDLDLYKQIYLAADFQIDQIPSTAGNSSFAHLTPAIRQQLEAGPDSDYRAGYVYYSAETHEMEPYLRSVWEDLAAQNAAVWNDYARDMWEQAAASGKIRIHLMGISQAIFEKLEWKGQPCSWDTFCDGKQILTDFNVTDADGPVSYYLPGDVVTMKYQSGREKTYTVSGEAKLPYSLDYSYYDAVFVTLILPEEEFLAVTQQENAIYATIDCPEKDRAAYQQYLEDTVLKENSLLHVTSSLVMERSFQKYVEKYYVIGAALVFVLGLIGVMNFFNMIAASILSRKKEFALLEAVGMTRVQCRRMLLAEGCMYLTGSVLLAVFMIGGTEQLIVRMLGRAFFFKVKVVVWPCFALVPVLYLIVHGIVADQCSRMQQESVVERIRNSSLR